MVLFCLGCHGDVLFSDAVGTADSGALILSVLSSLAQQSVGYTVCMCSNMTVLPV